MDWLKKFFKKEPKHQVDLPPHWPLEAPAVPQAVVPTGLHSAASKAKPVPSKAVINLSTPPPPPKKNTSRGKISTPEPAKKGEKTLNLAGRPDAYSRRSKSVIDMRGKSKGK
jgi:hypothetical protein